MSTKQTTQVANYRIEVGQRTSASAQSTCITVNLAEQEAPGGLRGRWRRFADGLTTGLRAIVSRLARWGS
jgi:hypothetical protein